MIAAALQALDRHWFAPGRLSDLALVRIIAFGSQTGIFLWYPDARVRSLPEQLLQTSAGAHLYDPLPLLRIMLWPFGQLSAGPPEPAFLTTVYVIAVAAGALATIGLFARPAMLAAAAAHALIVAHHYSYGEYHHAEALMIIALGVLALGPSAQVWSVDAARRRRRTGSPNPALSEFARWPLRVVQWLLALSYLSAAMSKLVTSRLSWFNGHTMTFYYTAVALATDREAPAHMATLPPALHILPSIIAWVVEAVFFVAILKPRYTWVVLLFGALLHLTVYATMGIAFFQTLLLYSVFVEHLRLTAGTPRDWLKRRRDR